MSRASWAARWMCATASRRARSSRCRCRSPRSKSRMRMAERRLLIVEDDEGFARTLARSFERRGYVVRMLHDAAGLSALLENFAPDFAVVDLRLGGASGLGCVAQLHAQDAKMRI